MVVISQLTQRAILAMYIQSIEDEDGGEDVSGDWYCIPAGLW